MKEYGSSVQKLVDYIMTIDDEEKRTKYAFLMVELMKQIHPNMKDSTQDYSKNFGMIYLLCPILSWTSKPPSLLHLLNH